MSLEKAIAHGKEHRKQYRDNDSRAFDPECRNHGGCVWCRKQAAEQKLKEYWQGDEQGFGKTCPSPFFIALKKVKKSIDNLSPPFAIYRKIIVNLSYDNLTIV